MLVYIVLGVYVSLMCIAALLYVPKFAQLIGSTKKPKHKTAAVKRKIALVIPARNESGVIGDLFNSVLRQDYDSSRFDVNVIVGEENDPTVKMAKKINANVFVVAGQKCKGDALDGYFRSLSPEKMNGYDAFVIIDADAVIADNYVSELNNALEYDRQIFVTNKHIKNYLGGKKSRSLICNCSALTYPILDELGNLYRTEKNVPLNFCGQGLMLRREVIQRLGGFPYRSLTEDYELKMDGYLRGFSSMYYPYAVIYTEEAVKRGESHARRLRWLTGYSQCEKRYSERVKAKIKQDGASAALKFDFLYYKYPVFICLAATALTALCGITLAVLYGIRGSALWVNSLLLLTLTPSAVLYLILFFYGLTAMISYRDAVKPLSFSEKLTTLISEPFFLLEFVPLYIRSRCRAENEQSEWKQTERVLLTYE